jgi:septal ring factor EnvC (AmiA/AmiB activator)
MAEKRVKFLARLAEAFSEMEKEIAALDKETAVLEEAGKKLAAKAAKLAKKAKIAETKLALYQNDIRDVMVELNNEGQNERKIAAEFAELARLLKSAADVPPWGMKVFAEAVEKELPRGEILQLQKPLDNLLHLH